MEYYKKIFTGLARDVEEEVAEWISEKHRGTDRITVIIETVESNQ